jgi:hypothetical protein
VQPCSRLRKPVPDIPLFNSIITITFNPLLLQSLQPCLFSNCPPFFVGYTAQVRSVRQAFYTQHPTNCPFTAASRRNSTTKMTDQTLRIVETDEAATLKATYISSGSKDPSSSRIDVIVSLLISLDPNQGKRADRITAT